MAGEIERAEAMLNAVSKIMAGDDGTMHDVRCPKCSARDFVDLPDLYSEAAGRLDEFPDQGNVVRVGGLTDVQIMKQFVPPAKKSPIPRLLLLAGPFALVAAGVQWRFGPKIGQLAFIGAGIVAVMVFLTTLRRLSDDYYTRRARWRRRYLCRRCGHLVET